MIDDIKKLTLQEIKDMYYTYLLNQKLSKNTIQTCCTDAFYLYRNDNTIDFWELLKSPNFEELAYKHLYLTLSKYSHGKIESNINGYMTSLRKFRNFLYSESININKLEKKNQSSEKVKTKINNTSLNIPKPSIEEVEKYLKIWNSLENYSLQERALNKLFLDYHL